MTATKTETVTMKMTETEMKNLVRNALMVAGQEMGAEGDHWPVVKETIRDVLRDWEALRVERNVHAEMKSNLYQELAAMDQILLTCTEEEQKAIAPYLAQLRELCDAFFADTGKEELYLADDNELYLDDADKPLHIRRAEAIIETLREDDHD